MSFTHESAHALRAHNAPEAGDRRLWAALAVSLLLHALLVFAMSGHSLPDVPIAPPPLIARLISPPPPEAPAAKRDEAPPPLIKNTIEPPKAEVLDDPIKPQPKKRITEKPEPQPPAPRPPVAAAKPPAPPEPAPVRPPVAEVPAPPVAAREERRPLDLSVPQDARTRGAERLSQQELAETMTRLSETMLYPSEALKRGLEGEVVIIVELGAGGRIIDAGIASGSGHAVLDEAAVRAVLKLGTLGNSSANRTILLPVRFRIL